MTNLVAIGTNCKTYILQLPYDHVYDGPGVPMGYDQGRQHNTSQTLNYEERQ